MGDRVKRVFDGLSLVAVGLVFLGNTLGVLPWSVWFNVLSLWPLLLVAAGVDLVGKALDSTWVRVLSSLVFIGGLAWAVFVMTPGGWPGTLGLDARGSDAVEFSGEEAGAGIQSGEARVRAPIDRLSIDSGDVGFAAWKGRSGYGEPDVTMTKDGSVGSLRIDGPENGWVFLSRGTSLDLTLDQGLPWEVRLDSGVSKLDADLSDLEVERLEVHAGIGNADISLGDPAGERSQVRVDAGISTLTVRLPADAEARIRFDAGIGDRDLPDDFERDGDVWTTSRFDTARRSWDILVKAGIGNVDVKTY